MFNALKQRAAYCRFRKDICAAFPAALSGDVCAVLEALSTAAAAVGGDYIRGEVPFALPDGERVWIPQRLYLAPPDHVPADLTETQVIILRCLYTCHYSGYVRQGYLASLLAGEMPKTVRSDGDLPNGDLPNGHLPTVPPPMGNPPPKPLPDWVFPFLLYAAGDYVVEIIRELDNGLGDYDNTRLRDFCRRNLQAFLYIHARMVSYWNEFYRFDCYRYKDYIGKHLFEVHLGYGPSLERQRRAFKDKLRWSRYAKNPDRSPEDIYN